MRHQERCACDRLPYGLDGELSLSFAILQVRRTDDPPNCGAGYNPVTYVSPESSRGKHISRLRASVSLRYVQFHSTPFSILY